MTLFQRHTKTFKVTKDPIAEYKCFKIVFHKTKLSVFKANCRQDGSQPSGEPYRTSDDISPKLHN